jgi:hypothetical protein
MSSFRDNNDINNVVCFLYFILRGIMKKISLAFLTFFITIFMVGCHHHKTKSCPNGQVLAEGTNQCVQNYCLNSPCDANQTCTVGVSGPICNCSSAEQRIDENGHCYYDETFNINCSGHGHIALAAGENYCECDAGYEMLGDNKFTCVPKSFATFCPNGQCTDGTVIPYFENRANNGVNFVIMGDGYTASDLVVNGKFALDAKKFIGSLMSREPYKTYSKYINFYIIFVQSNQSGVDSKCDQDLVDTRLDACFSDPSITTLINVRNRRQVDRYISAIHKTAHLRIVVLNEDRYFGGTAYGTLGIFPRAAAHASDETILLTMYHEVGHAFGGLGDEYGEEGYNSSLRDKMWNGHPLRYISNIPNLSTTNDLNTIKWKSLIPYFNIGAFEGGYYRNTGVWRPREKCVMRSQFATSQLCPVCTEAIAKRIFAIIGEPFNLSDFLYHFSDTPPAPAVNIPHDERVRLEKMFKRTNDFIITEKELKEYKRK